jgi:catechol 2,3-dioxygenase-like lactoylglutathione lyase family enzyme
MITIGVDDLERSLRFYRDVFSRAEADAVMAHAGIVLQAIRPGPTASFVAGS